MKLNGREVVCCQGIVSDVVLDNKKKLAMIFFLTALTKRRVKKISKNIARATGRGWLPSKLLFASMRKIELEFGCFYRRALWGGVALTYFGDSLLLFVSFALPEPMGIESVSPSHSRGAMGSIW